MNVFNLFQRCRKDEISFDIVAKNGNNVKATFDFVECYKSNDSFRQCCFDVVAGVDGALVAGQKETIYVHGSCVDK